MDETQNIVLAEGLREVADWLDEHPDLPAFRAYVLHTSSGADARHMLTAVARSLDGRAVEGYSHVSQQVTVRGEFADGRVVVTAAASPDLLGGEKPTAPRYLPILGEVH
jgi:hypothetical protein